MRLLAWSLHLIKRMCGAGSNLQKLSRGLWASRVTLLAMFTVIPTAVFAVLGAIAAHYHIGHPVQLVPLIWAVAPLALTLMGSLAGMFLIALTLDSPQIIWPHLPLIIWASTKTGSLELPPPSLPDASDTFDRPPRLSGVR